MYRINEGQTVTLVPERGKLVPFSTRLSEETIERLKSIAASAEPPVTPGTFVNSLLAEAIRVAESNRLRFCVARASHVWNLEDPLDITPFFNGYLMRRVSCTTTNEEA